MMRRLDRNRLIYRGFTFGRSQNDIKGTRLEAVFQSDPGIILILQIFFIIVIFNRNYIVKIIKRETRGSRIRFKRMNLFFRNFFTADNTGTGLNFFVRPCLVGLILYRDILPGINFALSKSSSG
jgi:hypothetical protein